MILIFKRHVRKFTHWGVIEGRTADSNRWKSGGLGTGSLDVADAVCSRAVHVERRAR